MTQNQMNEAALARFLASCVAFAATRTPEQTRAAYDRYLQRKAERDAKIAQQAKLASL